MITQPDNHLLEKCLANAISEVIMTTAGVSVCHVHDSTQVQNASGVELTGAIMLQGERSAILSLKMSKDYASFIVSSMTGLDQLELSDEDLYDGVAEIVNIIAGKIKTRMEVGGHSYSLTQPFTVVGENVSFIYKEQVPQKIAMQFNGGDAELYAVLTFL